VAKQAKAKKGAAAPDDDLPRLSAHPRARAQIGMAKAWAGLIGFAAVTLLSRGAEVPWFDSLVRGLAGGIVAYVVAWTVAVVVWRHLARAELEVLRRRTEERIREEHEAAEAARKAAESGDAGAA
jgi:type VI protein secretion system component VasK